MASSTHPDPGGEPAATLARTRVVVAALAFAPVGPAVLAEYVSLGRRLEFLVVPAALLGIVSPVIGYRLYAILAERAPAGVIPRWRDILS